MRSEVLAVGKDARTSAMAAACAESPQDPELVVVTELAVPGLVRLSREHFTGPLTDTRVLEDALSRTRPDLAIIGPEEPLAAGYTDLLRSRGIPTFGPTKRQAMIESSKSWTRELLDRYDIPGNPENRLFQNETGLRDFARALGNFVVKPDGLTAGKGVRVQGDHFHSLDEGLHYAHQLLAVDGCVQIEEKLEGEEFSLQTITDGSTSIHCPPVQDHKRAFINDTGPNTGGMGSYSDADHSLPFLEESDLAEAKSINEHVIAALATETGEPYRGVLYGGFIATDAGVRLIEYNCRFGDPEAMNVFAVLEADFVDIALRAAVGQLHRSQYNFARKATVCKYVVPSAYPDPSSSPGRIEVPADLERAGGTARWYWAACKEDDTGVALTGSRSGAVVGVGNTLAEAEQVAEINVNRIHGPVRHRHDIGTATLIEVRKAHMRRLRGAGVSA